MMPGLAAAARRAEPRPAVFQCLSCAPQPLRGLPSPRPHRCARVPRRCRCPGSAIACLCSPGWLPMTRLPKCHETSETVAFLQHRRHRLALPGGWTAGKDSPQRRRGTEKAKMTLRAARAAILPSLRLCGESFLPARRSAEAWRAAQLSLAPWRIQVRIASRSQYDNCFLLCGMRSCGLTRQSTSRIRLLLSGSPGITIGPSRVPFITP